MTRILLFASTTVALAAGAVTAAQGPIVPPPKTPPQNSATFRDQQHAVTIVGCLYGDRFVADTTQHRMALELVQATEFTLTGPKELLQQLQREHDSHQDEISGIVTIPGERQHEGDTSVTRINDKTRIIAGASSRVTRGDKIEDQAKGKELRVLQLRVTSLTHLEDKCSIHR